MALIILAGLIVEKMTGNVHFETPDPPLIALTTVLTAFTDAYNAAANEGLEEMSLKRVARLNLENVLRQLGEYVQHTSFGIEDRILTSGFDMAKKPEPIGPVEQPQGLMIRFGVNSGEVTLECQSIPKVKMYAFEYTDESITPQTKWTTVMSTKRQVNISGLTCGSFYEFRVAGVNSHPSRNWSEPIRKMMS